MRLIIIELNCLVVQLYGSGNSGAVSKETFTRTIARLLGRRKLGKEAEVEIERLFGEIKKATDDQRVTFGE